MTDFTAAIESLNTSIGYAHDELNRIARLDQRLRADLANNDTDRTRVLADVASYEAALATLTDATTEAAPPTDVVAGDPDTRPHSRACGWRTHPHGPLCHPNCPTCGKDSARS